ncbi:GGDEF domain-containing protein (plasmid) [Agrobacterium tumefaciens]|uniref:GGDEF domain-containing protein n=1 Tax=Agrobacterium tumefaciens TaxID=358 RepID=UPI001573A77D|nr:GGDEF domain-containing protein [Agrobacterium tumefaciens]NSZ87618.1 GGDEF domain-containing protein [Agrobacterium tumefaciens]WCA72943.1 GGDEF domain-containing protein [Agrobacterium tumefaciens]
MDTAIVRTTLQLVIPGILSIFGVSFVCTWLIDRKRHYLLVLACACVFFALGAASQIFGWPSGVGPNAVVSGAIYTAAVVTAAEGLLLRSGKMFGPCADVMIVCAFTALLAYFFYIDRNLLARVYIQNFGYGFVLLVTALRLSALARGRLVDRVLFWILLVFSIQFFPRTFLTIGFSAPTGAAAFANSVFWQVLQLSLAVLGAGLAMAILAVAVTDLIDDLRRERDIDHLTNVLNRRGFEERIAGQFRKGAHALLLCDIDKFKGINDKHGHDVGDIVLKAVARQLDRCIRKGDIVGRLGGEEFAVFLPNTSAREAQECAERLRLAIQVCEFEELDIPPVTASFGAGSLNPGESWIALYKRVDALLYEAKRSGRNRTISDNPPTVSTVDDTADPFTLRGYPA